MPYSQQHCAQYHYGAMWRVILNIQHKWWYRYNRILNHSKTLKLPKKYQNMYYLDKYWIYWMQDYMYYQQFQQMFLTVKYNPAVNFRRTKSSLFNYLTCKKRKSSRNWVTKLSVICRARGSPVFIFLMIS